MHSSPSAILRLASSALTERMTINTATNNTTTSSTATNSPALHRPAAAAVHRLLERRSYATVATVSPAGRPHAAGVLYELVDDAMYVNTMAHSRKARNVAASGHVGVVVPVRRVPIGGPPSAIQFQATARLLEVDDPDIDRCLQHGRLRSITGHGELELPGSCFLRIELPRRLHTYGLGMSLAALIKDPLTAAGLVELDHE